MSQIDEQQLRCIVAGHAAALALYARQWCSSPDDAVQEALIELLEQNPPPRDAIAWLFTTVRRRALNQTRGEQRRSQHQQRAAAGREPWFQPALDANLTSAEVEAVLERLDPTDREIVVAKVWGELSFEQIATLVQRSSSHVHRRYHHALSILHNYLQSETPSSQQPSATRVRTL